MSVALKTNDGNAVLPEFGEPLAGGFYSGLIAVDGQTYAIIVSPKTGDIDGSEWSEEYSSIDGAKSYNDGMSNTKAMADAGSELAKKIVALDMGGFNDWYLPSQDELEIIYRNLKPTKDENWLYGRSGVNASALPPTHPYLTGLPSQTRASAFMEGGDEAFENSWYWSSTQRASDSDYAWCQIFGDGNQDGTRKVNELRARAVRRLPI